MSFYVLCPVQSENLRNGSCYHDYITYNKDDNHNYDDDDDEWSTGARLQMVLRTKPRHLDIRHSKASKDLGAR